MSQGHHRAEGALGAAAADAGEDRRLGDHRARLGLGRLRRHEVDGAPRRRRLRPQRQQDLHHQRPVRRHHRLHLQARRRRPTASDRKVRQLRPRQGHARPRAVEAAAQDGHALVAHRRAVPRRRARREGPPASARPRTARRAPAPRPPSRSSAPASPRWRSASSSSASSCASTTRSTRVQFGQPDRRVPAHPAEAGEDGSGAHEHPEPGLPPDRDWRSRASR